MLLNIFSDYISPSLAITAGLLTIYLFVCNKPTGKRKFTVLIFASIVSLTLTGFWGYRTSKFNTELLIEKQNYERKKRDFINEVIAVDASHVVGSIVISGWESYGDYISYLTTIVGFYYRHVDLYSSEYDSYSQDLDFWRNDFQEKTRNGKTIYASDYEGLIGLVKSSKDYLEEIANPTK